MSKSTLNKTYGWRPDKPDQRDHKFSALLPPASLPAFVDLRRSFCTVYNQLDLGSCHDIETEVLSSTGWIKFADLSGNELLASVDPKTSNLIYEKPTKLFRFPYSGKMICADRIGLNFCVTPDHKMVVRKWSESGRTLNPNYSFVDAKDIGWYCGLINRVKVTAKEKAIAVGNVESYIFPEIESVCGSHFREEKSILASTWFKFLGIYLAEGTALIESKKRDGGYKIQIAASKEREKIFCRQLFADLGIIALELKDRFTFSNKQIYKTLEDYGLLGVKAPFKFVPQFVFEQDSETIKFFLSGHFAGDGCEDKNTHRRSHYTSSKKLAEDLQRLIFLSGDESRISERSPRTATMKDGRIITGKHPEYRVSVCNQRNSSIRRKSDVFEEDYEGEVFCAEMPSFHTLVTRRNNCILVSGNCTANAIAGIIESDQIKQNLPIWIPSRLFIYYNERVIEDSVNSDAGAEIRDGIKSINSQGVCPESEWPYVSDQFTTQPPASCYTNAAKHKSLSYQSINQDLTSMKSCLAGGFGFAFGFSVYESFESDAVAKTGVVPMPRRQESVLGGHAVDAVGYNDGPVVNGMPTGYFLCRNSWGPFWGISGYFFMPYAYLTNVDLSNDFWKITTMQ